MTDRNIVDLAHAVLDAVVPDVPWKIQLQEFQARAAAAPALARAVIAVAELADSWESVVSSYDYEAAMQNAAMDLRAALNGDAR